MPDTGYVELPVYRGGPHMATEDVTTDTKPTKMQRVKIATGVKGTDDGDVGPSNRLPVDIGDATLLRYIIATGKNVFSNSSGDFTATPTTGAKTITLSSYVSTLLSSSITVRNFLTAIIQRQNVAGDVDILPVSNVAFSANVLTLADMAANFVAGDTVSITLIGPDKGYDEVTDADRTIDASQRLATLDSITAKLSSEHLMINGVEIVPKFKFMPGVTTSGNNEIVALVASKKIRVLAYDITFSGTLNAYFRTSTAGAQLDPLHYGTAGSQAKRDFNPLGYFETVAGQALGLNLSAATPVDIGIVYIEV